MATLDEDNHIHVTDVNSEGVEELSFRDRVIKMSLGFHHLIVATATQCYIYNTTTWSSPVIFDLKDTVNLIVQAERCFLTVDNFSGMQVYNYEGRIMSNPKFGGLRTEFLSHQTISLSNDFLAILERADRKGSKLILPLSNCIVINIVDTTNGKPFETTISHSQEIVELYISQCGKSNERKVAFVDKNHDLYISPIHKPRITKLAAMVNSALWSDKTDMLAAILDGRFVVWLYPNAVFFDKDLANLTKTVRDTR